MSTYVSVVISPATTTRPVVISVSQATRLWGSSASTASRTESEIWSAILSGWPSVTDSEVNVKERVDMRRRLADAKKRRERRLPVRLGSAREDRPEVRQASRQLHPRELEEREGVLHIRIDEAAGLLARARLLLGLLERRIARELRAAAAQLVDRRLRGRDHELVADRRMDERDPVQRNRREQQLERGRGSRGVARVRDQRDLGHQRPGLHVDCRLAAEQGAELVCALPEKLLQLRRQRAARHLEVGGGEHARRDLVDERRTVRRRRRRCAGFGLDVCLQAQAALRARQCRGGPFELRRAGERAR